MVILLNKPESTLVEDAFIEALSNEVMYLAVSFQRTALGFSVGKSSVLEITKGFVRPDSAQHIEHS